MSGANKATLFRVDKVDSVMKSHPMVLYLVYSSQSTSRPLVLRMSFPPIHMKILNTTFFLSTSKDDIVKQCKSSCRQLKNIVQLNSHNTTSIVNWNEIGKPKLCSTVCDQAVHITFQDFVVEEYDVDEMRDVDKKQGVSYHPSLMTQNSKGLNDFSQQAFCAAAQRFYAWQVVLGQFLWALSKTWLWYEFNSLADFFPD